MTGYKKKYKVEFEKSPDWQQIHFYSNLLSELPCNYKSN